MQCTPNMANSACISRIGLSLPLARTALIILTEYQFPTDLDLVSIDVDGQDFHIWRGLRKFTPRLAIVEYNPTIPPHIEIIGDERGNDVGSSALALTRLGAQKGYSLIACIGWNAFFVHPEHAHLFADADNLDALFDYSYLRYAMQSYNGQVFFSAPLHLTPVIPLLSPDTNAIERASVELGKSRNTFVGIAYASLRYYLRHYLRPLRPYLRPFKRLYLRLRAG